jgi:hypothetical protein
MSRLQSRNHKGAVLLLSMALLGSGLGTLAQDLPNDKAETINGKKVNFPDVIYGSVTTCVFGFGNDSADRVGVWLESLSSDHINAWSVVNLESVPAVARGALRMTMRKGTPKELLERSLVISKDSKQWKQVLEVQKESLPVVVLFDKTGKIVWKRQGTFSSGITDELKAKIADLTGK